MDGVYLLFSPPCLHAPSSDSSLSSGRIVTTLAEFTAYILMTCVNYAYIMIAIIEVEVHGTGYVISYSFENRENCTCTL